MCGILAYKSTSGIKTGSFEQALAMLARRGPDSDGTFFNADNTLALGHRRLAIQDLSPAGHQPMFDATGAYGVVFNGEIYNYPQLKTELEAKGYSFKSSSDTEVLLYAYAAWGTNMLNHLRGMFAFTLWDKDQNSLFVARDRVGIKPLYYTHGPFGFACASSLKSLTSLKPELKKISKQGLAYVMSLGYVPAPLSIFEGINKLEPGHALVVSADNSIKSWCYWQPPVQQNKSPQLAPLFEETVKEHLLADVPVGIFLSGGIDSTAVAAAVKTLPVDQHKDCTDTFTIAYPGHKYNEAPVAASVANHLGYTSHQLPLEVADMDDLLELYAEAYDEPIAYSACLSMLQLCKQVAQTGYKVFLAGDGGDEVFAGYNWYLSSPKSFKAKCKKFVKQLLGRYKPSAVERFAAQSALHAHAMKLFPRFLPQEVSALLGINFTDTDMLAPLKKYDVPQLPQPNRFQRIDLMTFCSDVVLPKVDKASMHYGLEVRVPLLDHQIVENFITAPRNKNAQKQEIKDYISKKVPAKVLKHPKQGFSLRGMEHLDWQVIKQEIQNSKFAHNYLNVNVLEQITNEAHPHHHARLWVLLNLVRWCNKHS